MLFQVKIEGISHYVMAESQLDALNCFVVKNKKDSIRVVKMFDNIHFSKKFLDKLKNEH